MTDKREVELPAISLDPDDFDHGIDRPLARERQWRLGRERQLRAALQQLHVVLEREAATTARYDAKISQLEQQIMVLKLAGGLSCELHGCDSEGCTTQQYLKDAEKMLEALATKDVKIAELSEQIATINTNAAINYAAAEARTHAVEGELKEWQRRAFLYEAAFEDVMYQEYNSNANSIAQFLESAEREADDRMKARQESATEKGPR